MRPIIVAALIITAGMTLATINNTLEALKAQVTEQQSCILEHKKALNAVLTVLMNHKEAIDDLIQYRKNTFL